MRDISGQQGYVNTNIDIFIITCLKTVLMLIIFLDYFAAKCYGTETNCECYFHHSVSDYWIPVSFVHCFFRIPCDNTTAAELCAYAVQCMFRYIYGYADQNLYCCNHSMCMMEYKYCQDIVFM